MMQINYYLRPINQSNSAGINSYNKIIEYLLTFIGDVEVKKESTTRCTIYYPGSPITSSLRLEKTGQITVTISPNDNVTINLINNQAQSSGFRIYNPQINCYLPNSTGLYDLTTIKVDQTINNIMKRYHLTPLFQFRESLIFFAKAYDESIHLVNRHLLEYLISNPTPELFQKEFSVKIADNIGLFVALFDRGLISLTNPRSKITNQSEFNTSDLPKNAKLNVINFQFNEGHQTFDQQSASNTIPKDYLALKIGQDYTYSIVDNKLTKFVNVSVFNLAN